MSGKNAGQNDSVETPAVEEDPLQDALDASDSQPAEAVDPNEFDDESNPGPVVETDDNDDADLTDLPDEQFEDSADEQVADQPNPALEAPRQGNTDPRDFDVFDNRGNFVEKRDR